MDEKIIDIARNNNGYITNKILKDNNIPSIYMYRLVQNGKFEKIEKGIFLLNGYIKDEFYILHLLFPHLIFTFETAIYLNGLSNAQFSGFYAVVSYNSNIPKYDNLKIFRTRKSTISVGVSEVETPYGNKVICYDKERCICDLFIKPELYNYEDRVYAIKEYASKYLDLAKLYDYAHKLNIFEEVLNVFEVLGWN